MGARDYGGSMERFDLILAIFFTIAIFALIAYVGYVIYKGTHGTK
jgi:preprotein translocase subunit SecG